MPNIFANEACEKLMRSLHHSALKTEQGLWEYLLVANPDDQVNRQLVEEKQFFYNEFEQGVAGHAKPHIAIVNFIAKELMEETLMRWIQNICNLHASFRVTLHNFDGFPPHTIYLQVKDPKPFQQLIARFKMVDSFIQSNDCPPVYTTAAPHLAIARNLTPAVYGKALENYSRRNFHASFQVEKLVLMKREWEGALYHHIGSFRLAKRSS